jgi:hypothetical protein
MVHHTAPHIPFKSSEEWNAAQAQLNGTVHCNYPRWYVFQLCCIHTKNSYDLLVIGEYGHKDANTLEKVSFINCSMLILHFGD